MTDPWHILSVSDFSPQTLQSIIAHLEVSTVVERLHRAAHEAHDLVAHGRATEAATLLRGLLDPGVRKKRGRLANIPVRLRREQTR